MSLENLELQGFNPEKHRLSEDQKSWVNKEVPERDIQSLEIKNQYNELVNSVVAANPELSFQQAYNKITELEKHHSFFLFGIKYADDPRRQAVFQRRRLSILAELNILSVDEKTKLDELKEDINQTAKEIVDATGDDLRRIEENIDTALLSGVANTLEEAKEIMIRGPIIEGFESTNDPRIANKTIAKFLKDTFTPEGLRAAKIGRVKKDDTYLMIRSRSEDSIALGNEITAKKLAHWSEGMLVAEDRERYMQAEMILEGVDEPAKLDHRYKLRATAGESGGFGTIQLRSFGIENAKDYDYLSDIALEAEEDKMRAYMLGTIAHEVAHRYESETAKEVFDEYKTIIDEERSSQRAIFVSDYVLRHKEMYGSNDAMLFREDFAEAVRIYTTNPEYLEREYPRRFAFISKNFSFIKKGSVIEALGSTTV